MGCLTNESAAVMSKNSAESCLKLDYLKHQTSLYRKIGAGRSAHTLSKTICLRGYSSTIATAPGSWPSAFQQWKRFDDRLPGLHQVRCGDPSLPGRSHDPRLRRAGSAPTVQCRSAGNRGAPADSQLHEGRLNRRAARIKSRQNRYWLLSQSRLKALSIHQSRPGVNPMSPFPLPALLKISGSALISSQQ